MTGRALIFLCDIVGYSKLKDDEQSRAVQQLWDLAVGDSFIGGHIASQTSSGINATSPVLRMSGTGDGFYLVLWNYRDEHTVELYEFAIRLIAKVRQKGRDLKVALHEDPASTVKIPKHISQIDTRGGSGATRGWEQISGSGLNYCQRIVDYAGAGQVAFTEDFLSKWPKAQTRKMPKAMCPPFGQEAPIRINVKHNIVLRIRFDSPEASLLLQKTTLVGAAIKHELVEIMKLLHDQLSKYSTDKISARLSVFTPTYVSPEESFLDCTALRVAFDPKVNDRQTQTCYSITKGKETGLGICFSANKPKHLTKLPDYEDAQAAYCSAIKRKWGGDTKDVHSWSRHARAFLSIPIGLADLRAEPIGVLCIDLSSPLKHYKDSDLEKLCAIIHARVQSRLSFLLELRSRY